MKTDRTYNYEKMQDEMATLLASLNIGSVKDSLVFLLLHYCKHLNDVPASFSAIIGDLDALLELLTIIQRHEMYE